MNSLAKDRQSLPKLAGASGKVNALLSRRSCVRIAVGVPKNLCDVRCLGRDKIAEGGERETAAPLAAPESVTEAPELSGVSRRTRYPPREAWRGELVFPESAANGGAHNRLSTDTHPYAPPSASTPLASLHAYAIVVLMRAWLNRNGGPRGVLFGVSYLAACLVVGVVCMLFVKTNTLGLVCLGLRMVHAGYRVVVG